jgi:hypothetical protein
MACDAVCCVLLCAACCCCCVLRAAAAGAQVKDAMVGKDKVVTVKPGAAMSEAAQLMVHNDVSMQRSV